MCVCDQHFFNGLQQLATNANGDRVVPKSYMFAKFHLSKLQQNPSTAIRMAVLRDTLRNAPGTLQVFASLGFCEENRVTPTGVGEAWMVCPAADWPTTGPMIQATLRLMGELERACRYGGGQGNIK